MMLVFMVWLAGVVGSLKTFLGLIGFFIAVCCTAIVVARHCHWQIDNHGDEDEKPTGQNKLIGCIVTAFIMMFISALTPNEKTVYYMTGAYLGVTAVQSETGQKIVGVVNAKIDEYIEEMTKKGN